MILSTPLQPIEQLSRCSWFPFSDEPVLQGSWYLPKISGPTFLFPEDAPDGKWHIFVHSWLGIHHYISNSGIVWEPSRLMQIRGTSPYIFKDKGTYYLVYERHGGRIPFVERRGGRHRSAFVTASHVEITSSNDLVVWSDPRTILDSHAIVQSLDLPEDIVLSSPRIVPIDGNYRLYFGAMFVRMQDSKERSTRFMYSARASDLDGPFVIESHDALVEGLPNDPWRSLASGNFSVVKGESSYVAIQNGYYWDRVRRHTASALVLVASNDGKTWKMVNNNPILVPAETGWASKYLRSCDIRYKSDEACWYCYFSATGITKYGFERESIGLLIGKDPTLRKTLPQ
ncbi:MAG: hypothetical protein GXY60_00990 [Spirochaetales bacterium]|nr:hypothetical protein [Spirochaetales bacterium]